LRSFLSAHIPATLYLCRHPAPQKLPRISRRLAGKLPLPAALPGLAGISPWAGSLAHMSGVVA